MDEFKVALTNAVSSFSSLCAEWEKIEADYSDIISEKYPFDKDFREVLHLMIEWKEELNKKS